MWGSGNPYELYEYEREGPKGNDLAAILEGGLTDDSYLQNEQWWELSHNAAVLFDGTASGRHPKTDLFPGKMGSPPHFMTK
jgi:hypothetical protein